MSWRHEEEFKRSNGRDMLKDSKKWEGSVMKEKNERKKGKM